MKYAMALAGALFAAFVLCGAAVAQAKAGPTWDWVFVYYMAYDNNLEGHGRSILDMLKQGITSDRVAVVTLADFRDSDGMRRYEQTKSEEKITELKTEASAEEATLREQLEWVRVHYRAKKYAMVFLDHGNQLSEMSYDENPGTPDGKNWLTVTDVAPIVAAWRKKLAGSLEYLFIQQCGKGALENFHAFAGAAPYVMASQTLVGAPNSYYTAALKEVCAKPDIDGRQVSHLFQQHEADDMFTTYTTVNEKALRKLPEKLNAVLKPLLDAKEFAKPTILPQRPAVNEEISEDASVRMCFQPAQDEYFVDGLALLKALYKSNKLQLNDYATFARWVKKELVTEHRVSPAARAVAGDWCGFSLFVPGSPAALDRYKDYPIYKDTRLKELMSKMVR